MFDINAIAVDPKKAIGGTWVNAFGAKFKVARFNNRAAEAARASAMVDFYEKLTSRDGSKIDESDNDALQDIQARVMADHVLLDWKGLAQNGKELKFSADAAYRILKEPKYQDFYNMILRESLKHENFSAAAEKAIAKDVKPTASS